MRVICNRLAIIIGEIFGEEDNWNYNFIVGEVSINSSFV